MGGRLGRQGYWGCTPRKAVWSQSLSTALSKIRETPPSWYMSPVTREQPSMPRQVTPKLAEDPNRAPKDAAPKPQPKRALLLEENACAAETDTYRTSRM